MVNEVRKSSSIASCRLPRLRVMQLPSGMSQIVAWTLRRYVRYLVLGAVLSCAAVNVALHVGAGLHYMCEEECISLQLKGRLHPFNKHLLAYIRQNMLDPPAPPLSYKSDIDPRQPPWSKLGRWGDAHKFVRDYFDRYDKPGRYVEVGAQDGEFMSLTLHLEQQKFEGLLIEPNPVDYAKLRARNRHAYGINACASPTGITAKLPLWLRHNSGNLPPLLNRVQEGSNRLFSYVAKEDRELGDQVQVQCFPLSSMVQATFRVLQVDLLTISTHGGELDILSTLPDEFMIRMLVVMAPMSSNDEMQYLVKQGKRRGLTLAYSKSNMHIFLPVEEVQTVPGR